LLFGDPLLSTQEQSILDSRVVHATIDPAVLTTVSIGHSKTRDDDNEASDPDRIITNARPATPEDGLLTLSEIAAWFSKLPRLKSAYCEGLRHAREIGMDVETYGTRGFLPPGRQGFDEPDYTSYTFYWQAVLGESVSSEWNSYDDSLILQIIFFSWMTSTQLP
jgi:RNA exonuclease NGL2